MCCLDVLCENAFEFFDLWPHDELAVTEDSLDRRVDPWLELLVLSFQIDELHDWKFGDQQTNVSELICIESFE